MSKLVIATTRALPANRLGLTIAKGLRRLIIRLAGDRGFDTELWGMRLRLYPRWNGCEKGVLFTPQLYDVIERAALKQAIETAAEPPFVFIDIGANAGLYSLYVAAETRDTARIIAIEPQPQMVERLTFNTKVNMLRSITVVPAAATTAEGKVTLSLDSREAGGANAAWRAEPTPYHRRREASYCRPAQHRCGSPVMSA
jgi:FkbM family methyltransferase